MRPVTILNSSSLFSSLPLPLYILPTSSNELPASSLTSTAHAVSGGTNLRNQGANISGLVTRTM